MGAKVQRKEKHKVATTRVNRPKTSSKSKIPKEIEKTQHKTEKPSTLSQETWRNRDKSNVKHRFRRSDT